MNFERFDSQFILYSEHPLIPRPKKTYTSKHIEKIIKDPSQSSTSLHDVLLDGLVELCKVKPVGNDAIKWLGEWLLANNPNTPKVEVATI